MNLQRFWTISSTNPHIQRRGQIILWVSVLLIVLLLLATPIVFVRPDPLPSVLALILGVVLVLSAATLAWRGQVDIAGWLLVLISATIVVLPSILRREISESLYYLTLPILIAGVALRPAHVWVALAGGYVAIALNVLLAGVPLSVVQERTNLLLVLFTTAGIGYISARSTQQALARGVALQAETEQAARALEQVNRTLEAQVAERTASLQQALSEVETRMATQAQLLAEVTQQRATIREMSTPVLPISRHVLVMPLVGALDDARLRAIQEEALTAIEQRRARRVLLDITGVPVVDSQVAQGLMSVVGAARLLGAEVTLIGVRPEVAQAIVSLGIDLSALRAVQDLETALNTEH